MEIEKLGVPVIFLVVAPFESDARHNAKAIGMPNLSVKPITESKIAGLPAERIRKAGTQAAKLAIDGLTKEEAIKKGEMALPKTFSFKGKNSQEALEKMEKYFLNHMMSDGFPIVPPIREAVVRMYEGTDLAPDYLIGVVGNGNGLATVEKIAINAAMAGCLPQYMPVIIAAVEAITDPAYDLFRVQSTAGPAAPLLIVSGPQLIEDLNINDGYGTIGPGWKANSTIGRAVRLILINIGHSWPGKNDMKSVGLFPKFTTLMAENEATYKGFWEPLRVVEGFGKDQATVSVMTANSLKVIPGASLNTYVEEIASAMKGAYNAEARAWGEENLILLNPSTFDVFHEAKLSRSDVQKMLFQAGQVPCSKFARYRGVPIPLEVLAKLPQIPEGVINSCKQSMENLVPIVPKPADIKIIAAGGPTGGGAYFIDTWGFGTSFFTTKAIKLPKSWVKLLEKYAGWETPIIK